MEGRIDGVWVVGDLEGACVDGALEGLWVDGAPVGANTGLEVGTMKLPFK